MGNPYRDAYMDYTVPWLYERDPDSIRPDILHGYEDYLEILSENLAESIAEGEFDPVPSGEGAGSSIDWDAWDADMRRECAAAHDGDAPWTLETWTYYLENRDEIDAITA